MKYLIGIQPTGKLHIGNYLGCIRKGLQLQNEGHDVTFLIANLHAMTTGLDHTAVHTLHNELNRLGCQKVIRQDLRYTQLFYELCCKMNLGTLLKMPQYKDKKESVQYDLGLLLYPVLMAADIIINDPDVIIIGRDQVPHIELANDIAKRYGVTKHYEYQFGDVEKVMSLKDPTKKMSKSLGDAHVLHLFNEDYLGKLMGASSTPEGFENLSVIAAFFGLDGGMYIGRTKAFKDDLAKAISDEFGKVRVY